MLVNPKRLRGVISIPRDRGRRPFAMIKARRLVIGAAQCTVAECVTKLPAGIGRSALSGSNCPSRPTRCPAARRCNGRWDGSAPLKWLPLVPFGVDGIEAGLVGSPKRRRFARRGRRRSTESGPAACRSPRPDELAAELMPQNAGKAYRHRQNSPKTVVVHDFLHESCS